MSANRHLRPQEKRDAHKDIITQLHENISDAEVTPQEEEARLRAESEREDDRRETIISGFDPDSNPLTKFSFREDFNDALLDAGYLTSEEELAVEAIRRQLPVLEDRWWDIDMEDYFPSPHDLRDLKTLDGVTATGSEFVDDMERI